MARSVWHCLNSIPMAGPIPYFRSGIVAASEQYGPGSKGGRTPPLTCSFEKVSDLVAGFLGVVDGHLRGLFGALGDVPSGILGGAVGQTIGLLGTVGGFHGKRLGAAIDARDRGFRDLQPVLSDIVDLPGSLLGSFGGVVNSDLAALFQSMKCIPGERGTTLCAVDRGSLHEVKGMFGSVSQLHDDGLGGGVQP